MQYNVLTHPVGSSTCTSTSWKGLIHVATNFQSSIYSRLLGKPSMSDAGFICICHKVGACQLATDQQNLRQAPVPKQQKFWPVCLSKTAYHRNASDLCNSWGLGVCGEIHHSCGLWRQVSGISKDTNPQLRLLALLKSETLQTQIMTVIKLVLSGPIINERHD